MPLRERHGHEYPDAPSKLIASVAQWIYGLPERDRNELSHAFWVFRSADHERTPPPAQMAMIGAVVEGLFDAGKPSEAPVSFKQLHDEAVNWARQAETSSGDPERRGFAKRLAGYLTAWKHQDRRVAWSDTFGPLFSESEAWLERIFSLYQKHRHPAAHGDFVASTKAPRKMLHARGRLAGFVNLVIAAKAGYEGPILESPFGDAVMELGQSHN